MKHVIEKIKGDWKAMTLSSAPFSFRRFLSLFFASYKYRILVRLRLASSFIRGGWFSRRFAGALIKRNARYGCEISPYAEIAPGLRIAHPCGIVVGDAVVIGANARVMHGVTIGGASGKCDQDDPKFTMPRLQDCVLVGAGSCILGPVRVGDGAVIGANSIVSKDVNSLDVVSGQPSKVIKTLTKNDVFPLHYPAMFTLDLLD